MLRTARGYHLIMRRGMAMRMGPFLQKRFIRKFMHVIERERCQIL